MAMYTSTPDDFKPSINSHTSQIITTSNLKIHRGTNLMIVGPC